MVENWRELTERLEMDAVEADNCEVKIVLPDNVTNVSELIN
jgi:hypothetical protein